MDYLIIKDKDKKNIVYFDTRNLDGFKMNSKNKNLKLKDAINVNKMVIINQTFIDKVINRNINRKMEKLINNIISIYDNDDATDPSAPFMMCLNEVEKFKRELLNRYISYMKQKDIQNLDNKIKMLEREITIHAYNLNEYNDEYNYIRR